MSLGILSTRDGFYVSELNLEFTLIIKIERILVHLNGSLINQVVEEVV